TTRALKRVYGVSRALRARSSSVCGSTFWEASVVRGAADGIRQAADRFEGAAQPVTGRARRQILGRPEDGAGSGDLAWR
ncbi:MAG TPA: hypothetical protein VF909_22165, partial [Roseiflexaceae bacterium]